jgi:hypothetical protein
VLQFVWVGSAEIAGNFGNKSGSFRISQEMAGQIDPNASRRLVLSESLIIFGGF